MTSLRTMKKITQDDLIIDPLQVLRCDRRVFSCAPILEIVLYILKACIGMLFFVYIYILYQLFVYKLFGLIVVISWFFLSIQNSLLWFPYLFFKMLFTFQSAVCLFFPQPPHVLCLQDIYKKIPSLKDLNPRKWQMILNVKNYEML